MSRIYPEETPQHLWQLVPVLCYSDSEEVLPRTGMELPVFQLVMFQLDEDIVTYEIISLLFQLHLM